MARSIVRLVVVCAMVTIAYGVPAHAGDLALIVRPDPGTLGTVSGVNLDNGGIFHIAKLLRPVHAFADDGHGTLYGVDAEADVLLEIDPATGEVTEIGSLRMDAIPWALDLACDDAGSLWMVTFGEQETAGIYSVDRSSGHARFFTTIEERYLGGIASRGGFLYVAGELLGVVDPERGVVERIGGEWGLEMWWAKALDFDRDGGLVVLGICVPCAAPFEVNALSVLDLEEGTVDFVTLLRADAMAVEMADSDHDPTRAYLD